MAGAPLGITEEHIKAVLFLENSWHSATASLNQGAPLVSTDITESLHPIAK